MNWNWLSLLLILIVFSSASCRQEEKATTTHLSEQELKDKLLEFNKNKATAEDKIIDDYIEANYPSANTSSTGIRYVIYSAGNEKKAQNNENALIHYTIESLGGEKFHSTRKSGPEKVWIAHEDVPSGLHEALLLMALGDSAVFVMPSNRAYGLTGDQGNIPQNAILVYHVELIDLE